MELEPRESIGAKVYDAPYVRLYKTVRNAIEMAGYRITGYSLPNGRIVARRRSVNPFYTSPIVILFWKHRDGVAVSIYNTKERSYSAWMTRATNEIFSLLDRRFQSVYPLPPEWRYPPGPPTSAPKPPPYGPGQPGLKKRSKDGKRPKRKEGTSSRVKAPDFNSHSVIMRPYGLTVLGRGNVLIGFGTLLFIFGMIFHAMGWGYKQLSVAWFFFILLCFGPILYHLRIIKRDIEWGKLEKFAGVVLVVSLATSAYGVAVFDSMPMPTPREWLSTPRGTFRVDYEPNGTFVLNARDFSEPVYSRDIKFQLMNPSRLVVRDGVLEEVAHSTYPLIYYDNKTYDDKLYDGDSIYFPSVNIGGIVDNEWIFRIIYKPMGDPITETVLDGMGYRSKFDLELSTSDDLRYNATINTSYHLDPELITLSISDSSGGIVHSEPLHESFDANDSGILHIDRDNDSLLSRGDSIEFDSYLSGGVAKPRFRLTLNYTYTDIELFSRTLPGFDLNLSGRFIRSYSLDGNYEYSTWRLENEIPLENVIARLFDPAMALVQSNTLDGLVNASDEWLNFMDNDTDGNLSIGDMMVIESALNNGSAWGGFTLVLQYTITGENITIIDLLDVPPYAVHVKEFEWNFTNASERDAIGSALGLNYSQYLNYSRYGNSGRPNFIDAIVMEDHNSSFENGSKKPGGAELHYIFSSNARFLEDFNFTIENNTWSAVPGSGSGITSDHDDRFFSHKPSEILAINGSTIDVVLETGNWTDNFTFDREYPSAYIIDTRFYWSIDWYGPLSAVGDGTRMLVILDDSYDPVLLMKYGGTSWVA